MRSARELAEASMAAVAAGDREGWLALFDDDAVVEDPIGPSDFDPEGIGHRGAPAIAAFYDRVIGVNESIRFTVHQSLLCGDEVANVGVIRGLHVSSVAGRQDRRAARLLGTGEGPRGSVACPGRASFTPSR
jgi:ketosteroid isomerase-like protein